MIPRWLLWPVLALPAVAMAAAWWRGALLMDLTGPSGQWAIRFLILALLPGPLHAVLVPRPWLRAWLGARRNLGVAAFLYAALHTGIYAADLGTVAAVIDEWSLPAIAVGWAALAALLIPAAISRDAAMRWLGRRWKQWQRLVYVAVALSAAHWLLIGWSPVSAAVHLVPLIALWLWRAARRPVLPAKDVLS